MARRHTQETGELICQRIEEGESLRAICSEKDLPTPRVFLNWVNSDRWGIRQRYARARMIQADLLFDEMRALSQKALEVATGAPGTGEASARVQAIKLQVDTIKWTLSKLCPERWAETIKTELTGKNGKPLQAVGLPISPEGEAMIKRISQKRDALKNDKPQSE